ncbi:TPA: hypothetical protein EYN98_15085 [Candidatus Poribacteria bacterium]|jgi:hypothetical protein|nr:hypothetical protein [Candidatus Poribacteria bacterium]
MAVTTTNADQKPIVEFTEDQKYIFDTKGWIAIPSVLSDDEILEMRDFCYRLQKEKESIPEYYRSSIGGPLEKLTDHPLVVGFMNEFVASGYASENCYGFRFEGSFLTIRSKGHDNFSPHGGRGMLNFPGNSHTYHLRYDKAHSGLTRVVWELNPVTKGRGGTMFLSGSHKAAFPTPASTKDRDCPLWDNYSCLAGTVLFFTEAITHTGARWADEQFDRVAIFNCYNTVGNKWHRWEPHPEHLSKMPFKRQTLFRSVYCQDNVPSPLDDA